MAVKEVLSALEILTSNVPLHCQAWPDSRAFEALIMDYFAGSDDDGGDSETSVNDHNGISTGFNTFKLFTGFLIIDNELSECQLSNNGGNGVAECHD